MIALLLTLVMSLGGEPKTATSFQLWHDINGTVMRDKATDQRPVMARCKSINMGVIEM
jgi:hypothetical protein